jgi:RND family efflux transporter MFP subunit
MKRYLFAVSAALLLMATSCSGSTDTDNSTVHSVLVTTPQTVSNSVVKSFSGVVAESRTISLGFKTAGQISKTCVKEGDFVLAGQLIATLDDVDYKLAVREAKVQYDQMKSEQERLDYLYKTDNLSANDYEKSSAGLERLKINLENSQNRLNYTKLYAPVSGYVVKLNFERSEMVNAGTPVIELMDNSQLEVNVDLPAQAYANRANFKSFKATTTQGQTFNLKFISITPKADNNQLYNMRLAVAEPAVAKLLTAGMSVEVQAELTVSNADTATADTPNEVVVPVRAVFYDANNAAYVWTLAADTTVVATPVVVGELQPKGNVTITSGLNGTETIVRAGVHALQAGEKVTVIDETGSTNVGGLL